MALANLVITFIGGPKDGAASVLLRRDPRVPTGYPTEIQVLDVDEHGHEHLAGTYVRNSMTPDESAMRYVWTWPRV